MINLLTATLLCTGIAPTVPSTNIEVEIRPGKFSTIRYEYAEGPYTGTAYIQSIGHLKGTKHPGSVFCKSGEGRFATKLAVKMSDNEIESATFTHAPSASVNNPLECIVEN